MTKRAKLKQSGLRGMLVGLLALLALVGAIALPGCGSKSSGGAATSELAQSSASAEDAAGSAEDAAGSAEDAAGSAEDATSTKESTNTKEEQTKASAIDEDGSYTSKEEVALYLHTFGHLPNNYITKDEAEDAGWKSNGKSLDEACPGMSIGGDRFGNREGLLPKASGRTYQECDIDYRGGNRNAKRIVYSNDGLIFYTEDHYESFEQLY